MLIGVFILDPSDPFRGFDPVDEAMGTTAVLAKLLLELSYGSLGVGFGFARSARGPGLGVRVCVGSGELIRGE